ncbi:hypothetical protein EHM76_00660, partial [bacterium]
KIILYILSLCFSGTVALSQSVTTRNNYSGTWENPESWNPEWNNPTEILYGTDVIIYGTIISNKSVTITGTESRLYVRDTLIINGNLNLGNVNSLTVYDNGILIVRGNLNINNGSEIFNSGYLIVTGDFDNTAESWDGYFATFNYPTKVFIFGSVDPVQSFFYPVLFCTDSIEFHYTNSSCNYGNLADLQNDPIYSYFMGSCGIAEALSNAPLCEKDSLKFAGNVINLTGSDVLIQYHWEGPNGFSSDLPNPGRFPAVSEMSGIYSLSVLFEGCSISDTLNVIINPSPNATAQNNSPVCTGQNLNLTSSDAYEYRWTGPAGFSSSERNPTITPGLLVHSGRYFLKVISAEGCTDTASTFAVIDSVPVANAGTDSVLEFVFKTNIGMPEQISEIVNWQLISGSGTIKDPNSSFTEVSDLRPGENIFRLTLQNGTCTSSDDVNIKVIDLFVPSVITPNNDGKNDFFQIPRLPEGSSLIIFNRSGMTEFSSENYENNWNGLNNNNEEMPGDTYYFVIQLSNGSTRKGSILIKRK